MTAYLAPGVFVEEQNFRPASIAGLSTSVAAMVGPTRFGPIRGRPLLLTSYTDYQTYFGDALDLALGGNPVTNHTAYAARAFFDNNGTQLYLARIANDVLTEGAAADRPATASLVIAAAGTDLLTLTARFPGSGGNLDLVLQPRRSQKLLALGAAAPTDTALLTLSAVPESAIIGNVLPNTAFPLQKLTAIGTHQPANGGPERYDFAPNTRITYVDASGVSQTVPIAQRRHRRGGDRGPRRQPAGRHPARLARRRPGHALQHPRRHRDAPGLRRPRHHDGPLRHRQRRRGHPEEDPQPVARRRHHRAAGRPRNRNPAPATATCSTTPMTSPYSRTGSSSTASPPSTCSRAAPTTWPPR